MNWKRVAVLLTGCLACLFLVVHPASAATPCVVAYNTPFTAPIDLNAEGLTERPSDIIITGAGCFNSGSTLYVQYGAVMSVPTSFAVADRGVYWDFSDSTDSLSIDSIVIDQPLSASGYVTKIEININLGTTNPAAYVIIKNLRFDVTGTTGANFQSVADGNPLNVIVGTSNPSTTGTPFDVGNVKKTIKSGSVDIAGWGFENGVCPFSSKCGFPNKGATTGALIQYAEWTFSTNPAWSTDFPFRRVGETFTPLTADPNNIGPTDLVVDVDNIEAGVTVTLPGALNICGPATTEGGPSTILATWTLKSGGPSATGGNLVGIYQTTFASSSLKSGTLTVDTTNGAADPGCDTISTNPLISVVVGNPSLNNASGNMTTGLRVVMGPAPTAQFTGDDAQPTAVPRYLNYIGDASEPTREIIGANGSPVEYFYLNPTETVLLYPYVTTLEGWDTGIEVANTGNDDGVFGNTGQTGKIDLYFFPTNGTPFEYTVAAGVGRGLNASGDLAAGGDFADLTSDLITKAGGTLPFEGYVIAVGHFNFGHGGAYIYNGSGWIGVQALVLGGHCEYNPNKALPNPTNGAPSYPACSSARQGDITKLPERLDQ